MNDAPQQSKFPLQARLSLGLIGGLSMAIGVMIVVELVKTPLSAAGIGNLLGSALGLVVTVGFGVGLFWLAITYRVKSRAEIEALDTVPLPLVSDDSLVCRFMLLGGRVRRVVVDFRGQRIHFQHCHTPRKFLEVPQSAFSCAFGDLVDVHRCQNKGDSLTIVTSTGKAHIPSTATDYEPLCARLPQFLPETRPVVDVENPLMGILYVAAAFVGLFGGLALTPPAASVGWMGLLMSVGAGCGIGLIRAAVSIVNATTNRSVVPALVGGLVGAGIGWSVGSVVANAKVWSGWMLLIPVVVCAIVGFALGLRASKRILAVPSEDLLTK